MLKLLNGLTLSLSMLVLAGAAYAADEQASSGETDPPTIVPVPLSFDETGLNGLGAQELREQLPAAQFVMIGEDHGYADAPLLVSAFTAEGEPHGLDNYVIEVGPSSAEWIAGKLALGGSQSLAEGLKGRPLAVPFLNSQNEAAAAMRFSGAGQLWGVDQEFIGSPLIHLEWLAERADGDARALAEKLLANEIESFATGNQGAVLFASATADDWAALEVAFAEDEEALALIRELQRSADVYGQFFKGRGLDNNLDRVALIREYFLAAYHAAEKRGGTPPKAIMKFGATHAGRGTSPMATFDLGSLIEGIAAANELEALHIAYMPIGGEALAIRPSPDGAFSTKPAQGGALRKLLIQGGVDLSDIDANTGHYLIPLEPVRRNLRNKGLQELDGMSRFFVLGFDYVVTTSAGRSAVPLSAD